MTTLADKAILSGADNRPPMLEKDMYNSWKSRIELYMKNRQHRRMILESIVYGPLICLTIEENGVTMLRKYFELSPTDAIQDDCEIKATNIILQGLPPEVYALVNNHKVSKDFWERIQLLMQGTSLTKQDKEYCDELNNAKVTLMANLSYYGSDVLAKKAQQLEPKLYDGNVIMNTYGITIPDFEETLMLAEESRLKMIFKQQYLVVLEKKVNTTLVDYAALNQLSQYFKKRFVPKTKLSAEQAFWSQNSINSSDTSPSCIPTRVEVPKELPKVTMVYTSLKKLKHHLAGFDMVVKERTTATPITEGSWGFEHKKLILGTKFFHL
nr:hypothetical protein [Tanacetum cinerariifolium]